MSISFVPKKLRQYVKNVLGIQFLLEQNEELRNRLSQLENKFFLSREELENDAKQRWKNSTPGKDLTWSQEIPGRNFIRMANAHGVFGPEKSILEIGPGYGRLLAAIVQEDIEFADYLGIDISSNQVDFLTKEFANENTKFMLGDAETFTTDQKFDTLISSLTFKHLFPSCEKAMSNISQFMKPGAMACIDFIEGERRLFEPDGLTFLRHYSKEELTDIMANAGFEVDGFEYVEHLKDFHRLVVIARRTGSADGDS